MLPAKHTNPFMARLEQSHKSKRGHETYSGFQSQKKVTSLLFDSKVNSMPASRPERGTKKIELRRVPSTDKFRRMICLVKFLIRS